MRNLVIHEIKKGAELVSKGEAWRFSFLEVENADENMNADAVVDATRLTGWVKQGEIW